MDYPKSSSSQVWESLLPHVRACRATLDRYRRDGVYACRLVGAGLFCFTFLSSDETFY
jgi:hypothetical protein